MRKLVTSLDWSPIETELLAIARESVHKKDMVKLISNTRKMIDRLAASEIEDRHRGKRSHKTIEIIQEINDQILALEETLTLVKLIG